MPSRQETTSPGVRALHRVSQRFLFSLCEIGQQARQQVGEEAFHAPRDRSPFLGEVYQHHAAVTIVDMASDHSLSL